MSKFQVGDVVDFNGNKVTVKIVNKDGFLGPVHFGGSRKPGRVEAIYSVDWFNNMGDYCSEHKISERKLALITPNVGYFQFKVGDQVALKSGSPVMTVVSFYDFDPIPSHMQNTNRGVDRFIHCTIDGVKMEPLKIYEKLLMPLSAANNQAN